MASQTHSILRTGINSQRSLMQKSGAKRSILKRPVPLPLSPLAQNATFSVLISPSARALKSPHVHFPPSPSKLHATYVTHGPGSYDRGPISVSPNPLNLPGRGERVYSPSIEGFRLQAVPKPFRTLTYQASPIISDFEDPRSPKLPAPVALPGRENPTIRFAPFTGIPTSTRPQKGLSESLSTYPRSPYPSAPLEYTSEDYEMETRGRSRTRTGVTVIDGPSRARARASSLEARRNKRNKKGLTLGPQFGAVLETETGPESSPRGIFSPAVASLNRTKKPAPLALDSLAESFWQSVSLEGSSDVASIDEPMVTALEYPESAVEYEEKFDMTLRSAAQPSLMYANAEGALWSPALPVSGRQVNRIRESLMSPGVTKSFERKVVRRDFTAPSPNDPFAAFPSFTAALQMGDGIQRPAPVAVL